MQMMAMSLAAHLVTRRSARNYHADWAFLVG